MAAGALLVRSGDGRLRACVLINGRQEIYRLKSPAFRIWLIEQYQQVVRKLPPQRAAWRVVETLQARAEFEDHAAPAYMRVGRGQAHDASRYFLDLGDSSRRAVEISTSGWSIVENPPVHFWRPRGLLPLPVPARDGSIELLRPFVSLSGPEFYLLVAWLVAALRSTGPFPVLVLNGEQGSSKTTLARISRQVDRPADGTSPGRAPKPARPDGHGAQRLDAGL